MPSDDAKRTCFIAMPITTSEDHAKKYHDRDHWQHVLEGLFVPAVTAAGFEPVTPVSRGSDLIHGVIIKQLSEADMVLCDLSGHNPNVFFELGVRTSINKPVALVRCEGTPLPFDTSVINTHTYQPALRLWNVDAEVERLTEHIKDAVESCAGSNPMWHRFGLSIKAEEPTADASPQDAQLELLADGIAQLREEMRGIVAGQTMDISAGDSWIDSRPDPWRAVQQRPHRMDQERIMQKVTDLADAHAVLIVDLEVVGRDMIGVTLAAKVSESRLVHFRKAAREAFRGSGWEISITTDYPNRKSSNQDGAEPTL